jgi:hypothetical protein
MNKIATLLLLFVISLFATGEIYYENQNIEASIVTSKTIYDVDEQIDATVNNMLGNYQDWIGVYPAGSSNDWGNVLSWDWTNGIEEGTISLDGVGAGDYEVRAFFSNSFNLAASTQIKVNGIQADAEISTSKYSYDAGESIEVNVDNMLGHNEDWVGIYPQGASNDWGNVLSWSWTNGIKEGTLSLAGVGAGDYEVRAFFSNSFNLEASTQIKVEDVSRAPKLYENAENGLSSGWSKVLGYHNVKRQRGGYKSSYSVKLTTHWTSRTYNSSEYMLELNNISQKVLQLDVGGVGRAGGTVGGIHANKQKGAMPHYFIGVRVMTRDGERSMIWDSWFNHADLPGGRVDYGNGFIELAYPSPIELVRGFGFGSINKWEQFRVDLEEHLKRYEPNNTITSVLSLRASGGFLDNIKLSSN